MTHFKVTRQYNGMFVIEEKEGENPKDKTGLFDTLDEAIKYVRYNNNSKYYIIRMLDYKKTGTEKYQCDYVR